MKGSKLLVATGAYREKFPLFVTQALADSFWFKMDFVVGLMKIVTFAELGL